MEEAQPAMHPKRAIHAGPSATTVAGARRSGVRATALSVGLALTLLAGADAAQANTLNGPTYSPGPRATVPMTISVSGSADPTATLRVYVQQAGACPSSADVEAGSIPAGSTRVVAEQPVGAFSSSGSYTPPAAGSYTICAYLLGSGSTGTSASSTSFTAGVAPPAPPPPPPATNSPTGPGATGTAPALKRCVVPTLKGRSYFGARLLIRRAGCSVGSVFRPDLRTSRAARARGRVLRVVVQSPKARSVRKAGARVTLRLAYVKPPPPSR
ncbi:MAG: hypothetical protein QOG42_125 [Solirubrobacteraceae bacterium]|jgi:hypothetical protein|nr:hypothetical protein [Solirubrobacteraceae bacterium]